MNKVTVITPMKNNERTIARTIKSVINQTYQNFEMLIIDNGSQDNSVKVVQSFVDEDSRISLLSSEPGRSRARNEGLSHADGEYIQFLDSDDELLPDKMADSVRILDNNRRLFAVVSNVSYVVDGDDDLGKQKHIEFDYPNGLLATNPFPINSVLFRNESIHQFEEALEYNEDWLFWTDNLYKKPIQILEKLGAIIHVGVWNTMSDFDGMRTNELFIRSIVKKRHPVHSYKLLKHDLRLMCDFLLIRGKSQKGNIPSNFTMIYYFAGCLLRIPPLRKFANRVLENSRNHRLYE